MERLPNFFEEYMKNDGNDKKFLELFEAKDDEVDLRTDLNFPEISVVHKINLTGKFVNSIIKSNIYLDFIRDYLRFKVSLDRKSRSEFVDIHRQERFEQNLRRVNDFQSIIKDK